jgi:hypothetical protein
MIRKSPLEDPKNASFAWARYFRLMRLMGAVTLTTIVVAIVLEARASPGAPIHLYIATSLGIGVSMMLMAALMGLVFLSNGTGHDDSVVDPFEDDPPA